MLYKSSNTLKVTDISHLELVKSMHILQNKKLLSCFLKFYLKRN